MSTPIKKTVLFIAAPLLASLLICLIILTALPGIISSMSPALLEKTGVSHGRLNLDSLTGNRAVISLTTDNHEAVPISLPRMEIRYSPIELFQGKIRTLAIYGAAIHLENNDGTLQLKGLSRDEPEKNTEQKDGLPKLPVFAERIEFTDCRIILDRPGNVSIPITFSGTIVPEILEAKDDRFRLAGGTLSLKTSTPLAAHIAVEAENTGNSYQLQLNADIANLNGSTGFLSDSPIKLSGAANLSGSVETAADFTSWQDLDLNLLVQNVTISGDSYTILAPSPPATALQLSGNSSQVDFTLRDLDTQIADTQLSAGVNGQLNLNNMSLKARSTIRSNYLPEPLILDIEADHSSERIDLVFHLLSESKQFSHIAHTSPATAQGRVTYQNGELHADGNFQLDAIEHIQTGLTLSKIAGHFSYTPDSDKNLAHLAARVDIPVLEYNDEDLGEAVLDLTMPTSTRTLQLGGFLKGHQQNPVRIVYSGSYDKNDELHLTFAIEESVIDNDSLPGWVSLPPSLQFSANAWASGNFRYRQGTPGGRLNLKVEDGSVTDEEKSLSITGISTELNFDHLPRLDSRPSQLLSIESLDAGTIHIGKGQVRYRIEEDASLFIEKSKFQWCGGKVEMGSTRIAAGSREFSTTLYCDRLQFADLLGQFGISGTDGDGSLNGRLPVEFSSGSFLFDDGFLFSTPGNSGIVHFNNTDMLKQSLPDMNQAAYLDYSIQSLENFSYNWTKLTFNSEGEDLLISMQIDGKPASPLPFGYSKGQLVKKEGGQGIQHPLRLDVNFHLPFTEMFRYGQNIQKLMENM